MMRAIKLDMCFVIEMQKIIIELKNNNMDVFDEFYELTKRQVYVSILSIIKNKAISDDAPATYFTKVKEQCETKDIVFGNIATEEVLLENLKENCIPNNIFEMTVENYDDFLQERRKLMADLRRNYYESL